MSIPTANPYERLASSGLLLDAALSLAQTQLVGQLADETSLDGRTMGTLGFSGALLTQADPLRPPSSRTTLPSNIPLATQCPLSAFNNGQ